MIEERKQQFATAYSETLIKAMMAHPERYADTPATAPYLAARMTEGLAKGTASLSPQGKAAAKALGVHPTMRAIRAWLSGE